jgi:hypothetical protein
MMRQREALQATLRLAESKGMPELPGTSIGLEHLRFMAEAVQSPDFTDDKVGRWLGWAQCAVVAANIGVTLEDMKRINLEHLDGE